jgi:general secretion pathway protein E
MRSLVIVWLALFGFGLVIAPELAWAAEFPRGEGFYFSVPKMLAVLAYFLVWLFCCGWVDADAQELDLERLTWTGMTIAGGVVGLWLFWLMPRFFIGYVLALTLLAVPVFSYLLGRDAQVDPVQRVLTSRQFKRLLQKVFRIDLGVPDEPPKAKPVRIHFLPIGEERPQRNRRLQKARAQRGYRTLQMLLEEAYRRRANGIRVEIGSAGGMVHYQVDGLPHATVVLGPGRADGLVRVCLTLAQLNWPANGQRVRGDFPCQIERQRYRVRVSFDRQELRSHLTLRLYAETHRVPALRELGFAPVVVQQLQRILSGQRGLLIICGPEDSGRTQLAYTLLQAAHQRGLQATSVEWPCDVHLEGIRWVPAEPQANERFPAALKRVLGEVNADVVLAGDLDSRELFSVACQRAAKLDLLLIGTITADDAVQGLQKLFELGLTPAGFARLLTGVLAVRLVRTLCPACKVKFKPNPELLRRANLPAERVQFLYRSPERTANQDGVVSCISCQDLGYRGRMPIVELLLPTDELRELVKTRPTPAVLREAALRSGMRPFSTEALRLALEGHTSIMEVASYLQ